MIVSIEEKPKNPKTNYCVTGLYFYDDLLFEVIDWVIENCGYSERGELEISDVNNYYIKRGNTNANIVKGFWSDAGSFDTLLKSANFIKNSM